MTHDPGVTVRLRASASGHNGMPQTQKLCLYNMEAHDYAYHWAALWRWNWFSFVSAVLPALFFLFGDNSNITLQHDKILSEISFLDTVDTRKA